MRSLSCPPILIVLSKSQMQPLRFHVSETKTMVQQQGAPRFGVFFAGVIASPFLQHLYPEGALNADSLHLIGDKDHVKRVSGLDLAPRCCRSSRS